MKMRCCMLNSTIYVRAYSWCVHSSMDVLDALCSVSTIDCIWQSILTALEILCAWSTHTHSFPYPLTSRHQRPCLCLHSATSSKCHIIGTMLHLVFSGCFLLLGNMHLSLLCVCVCVLLAHYFYHQYSVVLLQHSVFIRSYPKGYFGHFQVLINQNMLLYTLMRKFCVSSGFELIWVNSKKHMPPEACSRIVFSFVINCKLSK